MSTKIVSNLTFQTICPNCNEVSMMYGRYTLHKFPTLICKCSICDKFISFTDSIYKIQEGEKCVK